MSNVFKEITAERERQIGKGFDAEWDFRVKSMEDFYNDIEAYLVWSRQMHRMRSPEKARRRLVQVASLAVAAIERTDKEHEFSEWRKNQEGEK